MAQLRRKEAEQLIKEILTEYARKIRSAKKREYTEDIQQQLFNPKIDAFYKLAKSEDMDFCIFNRLNDEGIRQLLVGCRRLAKCYELDSYGKIKDFTYEPESPKCRIASDSGGKYTAGGSYTFTLEGKAELGNKWYEPYRVVWHFYRENPGTGKYEETSSKMDEARALADFDTWDRSFLVSEKGRYKVTATIFNQAITTGIRPDIVEVCELYFEAEDDTDAAVANLKDYEKVFRAIRLANYGDAFESLGKDIAAIALTLVAFVGIGVILKKIPAGKLKPFLKKLAEKLALSELMTFFGTYGDAFDIAAFIVAVCDFYEQATNARNKTQLKEAAKTFERVVETFGLVAVMGFMDAVGHKMKKAEVENEINTIDSIPDQTVDEDAIVQKYLDKLNARSRKKLTKYTKKGKDYYAYEILKKYEAYFGDDVDFVNELIQKTKRKEIYVNPVQLLVNAAEKEKSFYKYCQSIKGKCKSNEQWVKYQIDCYNNLPKNSPLRINAQPIIDARYLKKDGSIDWPKFLGMKPETIKGITTDNNLPTNLSRKGVTDFGKTFGDNPDLPNAKIATPYIDNPKAVHFSNLSEEGKKRYFELIDTLNNNDKKKFSSYFEDEIEALDYYDKAKEELDKFYATIISEMTNTDNGIEGVVDKDNYLLYFKDIKKNTETQKVSYKYGLQGIIAPWKPNEPILIGGGNQFSLPFTMDLLEDLEIIDVKY